MKKTFFLLPVTILIIAFTFSSCNDTTKPEVTVADAKVTGSDHLRMYFEGLHPMDQMKVFHSLPASLKYELFSNHWNNQMAKAAKQEQKNFIKALIDHLKPEYYSNPDLFEKEAAGWFRQQAAAGLKVFEHDSARLRSVMVEIGGDTTAKRMIKAGDVEDCNCSTKDDWCVKGRTCRTGVCIVTKSGCGGGWLSPCDGLCIWNVFGAEKETK
jgi:hypothetical protein